MLYYESCGNCEDCKNQTVRISDIEADDMYISAQEGMSIESISRDKSLCKGIVSLILADCERREVESILHIYRTIKSNN